jgi:hypothetical protein
MVVRIVCDLCLFYDSIILFLPTCFISTGWNNIIKSGLMTAIQIKHAESNLLGRMQSMMECQSEILLVQESSSNSSSSDEDNGYHDDVHFRSMSTEWEKAMEEYHRKGSQSRPR